MSFIFARKRLRDSSGEKMNDKKLLKPGDIFLSVTGKSIVDCATIDDVDAAVSTALRLVGPLKFDGNDSGLVIRSGDVFPHLERSLEGDIDRRVDDTVKGF
jgi:hypothetical protein